MTIISDFFKVAFEKIPVITFSAISAAPDQRGQGFFYKVLSFLFWRSNNIEPHLEEPLVFFFHLSSQDSLKAKTSFDEVIDMLCLIETDLSNDTHSQTLLEEAIDNLFVFSINQVSCKNPTRNDVLNQFFSLLNITYHQQKTSCQKIREMGLSYFFKNKIHSLSGLNFNEVGLIFERLCDPEKNYGVGTQHLVKT